MHSKPRDALNLGFPVLGVHMTRKTIRASRHFVMSYTFGALRLLAVMEPICIDQERKTTLLCKDFNVLGCEPVVTPMQAYSDSHKSESRLVAWVPFQQVIGFHVLIARCSHSQIMRAVAYLV